MCLKYEFTKIERNTLETQIKISLDLSRSAQKGLFGTSGIGFFDHMLNSFAIHLGARLELDMTGDLHVDCHHTIEDVGICLGQLLGDISQNNKPLKRYGTSFIPMDEALARTVIDISGRPYLVCDYAPKAPMVGQFDTQMVQEFFRAVAFNMGATLHIAVLYAQNDHHAIEAIFKSFAHAVQQAIEPVDTGTLSAKGVL